MKSSPKRDLSKRYGLQVITSNVVEDQGNRFVAHKVNVSAPADITAAVDAVKYSQYSIATASHNMYATRIQVGKFIHEYSDDDGEHSGSREIMNELRKRKHHQPTGRCDEMGKRNSTGQEAILHHLSVYIRSAG